MALLQINEPGKTQAPHQHRLAAGIDLGTTNSLVASVRSGQAATLLDQHGEALLPSVVYFGQADDEQLLISVGQNAQYLGASDPQNCVSSIKRLMGRTVASLGEVHLPYALSSTENGVPQLLLPNAKVTPVEVSAKILSALAERATATLGGALDGVVITVPAYFDDAQRQATKDAAALAGLHVLRLLNEPTAAAIAYGLDSGQEGVIAVYDLGGGTFDISILRLTKGVFEVLATSGDAALGGDDFDRLLADWIATQAGFSQNSDLLLQQQLMTLARATKVNLSNMDVTEVSFAGWQGEITRQQFNQLIEPLVKRTLRVCRRAMLDAGLEQQDVREVVMVGGSTRVRLVRQQVGEFFKQQPLTSIDPDQVVAIGAAIQADILVGNKPDSDMLLLDVIPLSLGIETMGELVEKIIPRNSTIPCARAQDFTTFKDGQTAMMIHVLQGERETVADCRSLAKFILHDIPPMPAGGAHIRVTFQVDADGLLSVTAMEKSTGVQTSVQVKPSYGLDDKEIASMIKESLTYAEQDKVTRRLAEQRVEAARVLESLQAALNQDSELLSEQELATILQVQQQLITATQQHDAQLIEQQIKQLDRVTQEFAARRMDRSVQQALAGQHIEQLDK